MSSLGRLQAAERDEAHRQHRTEENHQRTPSSAPVLLQKHQILLGLLAGEPRRRRPVDDLLSRTMATP